MSFSKKIKMGIVGSIIIVFIIIVIILSTMYFPRKIETYIPYNQENIKEIYITDIEFEGRIDILLEEQNQFIKELTDIKVIPQYAGFKKITSTFNFYIQTEEHLYIVNEYFIKVDSKVYHYYYNEKFYELCKKYREKLK
ncbi:MAG: hypothetical protein NC182_04915 [Prevotella sp.]|nr:hypothetical protein [Staphylococcus sp.]MCM1350525.1 hypothetical protein [Prevotella sp.]